LSEVFASYFAASKAPLPPSRRVTTVTSIYWTAVFAEPFGEQHQGDTLIARARRPVKRIAVARKFLERFPLGCRQSSI
jgi:hypothetical protein